MKYIISSLLSEKYDVLMTPGSFNTTMGVVRTVREQLKPTHQVFVVEMGAKNKGDITKIIILTFACVVLVCCFTALDNLLNIWLFKLPKVAIKIYIVQSIPVAITQMICALVTVPLCYYPLYKVFNVAKQTLKKGA
jgi:hypothetical protein